MSGLKALSIAAVVGLGATAASAQNLLTNSSFETPTGTNTGNNIGTVPTGFTSDGTFNLVRQPGAFPNQDGDQFVDLTGGGTFVSQNFTLGAAGTVSFGGSFSGRDGGTGDGFTEIRSADGTTVLATSPTVTGLSTAFVSSSSTASLGAGEFQFRATFTDNANVDSVFVAIPEPASLAVLGLGGLGGLARRRRTA